VVGTKRGWRRRKVDTLGKARRSWGGTEADKLGLEYSEVENHHRTVNGVAIGGREQPKVANQMLRSGPRKKG
jgi:hypothetical protein